MVNGKLPFSQAAENNKGPILNVLRDLFEPGCTVLEIGSGTGQHAVWFARHMPELSWQPSEQPSNLATLGLRLKAEAPANLAAPIALDVAVHPWPVGPVDAVYSANCIHIMSWEHVKKMFLELKEVIKPGGLLVLYGPFKYKGAFTSSSNALFEQWLKGNDPESGIRDFEKVNELAQAIGLELLFDRAMPANNQCLVWKKTAKRE